uniref:Ketoreductase (KR) domain-containing protein n=1 Tax=Chromera velia CCMP2878 TaxID=1169474 RepID=A0A0G4I7Y5_9ALVE|eukprot:Cvel_1964.t1-p1 / transcript=Cvel_1964.t1 / gene=Cvel_1964 / organism=Chromera_velia_CCMP2878 / gene_product=Short-chain dehydrogenase TIC 32, chloroplastic, putative / transcript_product=Short-chain dehydrogenase TIC 32, chloroplastic, putative / location=Cvel_scaffold74:117594-122615(+) / protein_length=406 / sequence_SO=supercontig / SO=protein_coding / is_pseudo=false
MGSSVSAFIQELKYFIALRVSPFLVQNAFLDPSSSAYTKKLLNKNPDLKSKFKDKCAVVTGVSLGGLGYYVAEALAVDVGMAVVLAGRSKEKLRDAETAIEKRAAKSGAPSPKLFSVILDLSSLKSVEEAAGEMKKIVTKDFKGGLKVLVNNAGALVCAGAQEPARLCGVTKEGIEGNVGGNFVGPHYLTSLLLPCLEKEASMSKEQSKCVFVSSLAHAFPFQPAMDMERLVAHPFSGGSPEGDIVKEEGGVFHKSMAGPLLKYGHSKLGNMSDARAFARRHPTIDFSSNHPGSIRSNFGTAGLPFFLKLGRDIYYNLFRLVNYTAEQGGVGTLRGVLDPSLSFQESETGSRGKGTEKNRKGPYLHCTGTEWSPKEPPGSLQGKEFDDALFEATEKLIASLKAKGR